MIGRPAVASYWQRAITAALVFGAALLSISCGNVMANLAGASDLTLNTSTLDFGSASVGSSKSSTLSLTNSSASGGPNVTVAQVAASGPGFAVHTATLPVTLAAGQTTAVTVTFTPQSAGAATGSLSITILESSSPTTVDLSGTGVGNQQLIALPYTLNFGSVTVGTSATLSGSLTAGGTSITVSSAVVTGQGFSFSGIKFPVTVPAGTSIPYSVVFAPKTATSSTGSISFVSNAANSPFAQALTGIGAAVAAPPPVVVSSLAVSPATLAFGTVTTGSSKSLTGTLTAGAANVTVSSASISGQGYSLSGISFPVTIAAGKSVSYSLTFTPSSAASSPGTIAFVSDAANSPTSENLTGSGAQPGAPSLAVSPSTLSFGNVAVGSSKSLTGNLTASGASVSVSSAAWNGAGYSVSGISFPVTVAAGSSVSYTVTFAPQSAGSTPGGISFASNASNSPTVESFSGTGTQAAVQHTVNLSWNASTTSGVSYNVYRGTVSGGPYVKLNSAPQPGTTYADATVQSGSTYYYVTTAVSNGSESSYSNEVSVAVPSP